MLGKKNNIPIDKNYFLKNNIRKNLIATKTFILILADKEPLICSVQDTIWFIIHNYQVILVKG